MKTTGQGVLHSGRRAWLLACVLLFSALIPASRTAAGTPTGITLQKNAETVAVVTLVFSEKSPLQKKISLELLQELTGAQTGIGKPLQIRLVDADKVTEADHKPAPETDLVLVIGAGNIALVTDLYPQAERLFIVTDPGKISPQLRTSRHDILYMTQPFCRQLQFIHLLNPDWKKVGYLTSERKYPDDGALKNCAGRYHLQVFRQYNRSSEQLSSDLKSALQQSDLLLAFPDSNIYNRKTVKNILLTSYRARKPVIAFSRNFVNAGAIAAIHSNPRQIAAKANSLVSRYFSVAGKPRHREHYPDDFDISINRQVFKALHIRIPDIKRIKKLLNNSNESTVSASTGVSQ